MNDKKKHLRRCFSIAAHEYKAFCYKTINMATILYFKRIVLSSQQHAYPASRQISALRVSFLFLY